MSTTADSSAPQRSVQERLTAIETAGWYEARTLAEVRQEVFRVSWGQAHVLSRIESIERQMAAQLSAARPTVTAAMVKLVLAVALPTVVLLLTGSPDKVMQAARAVGGMP